MGFIVISKVDPRDLAVNNRYLTNKTLPKVVRDAKINLTDDVFEQARSYDPPYSPPEKAEVYLSFTFPTLKNDLDGPIKHTLDALQDGLRKAGHPQWNDRSIWRLNVLRRLGRPGIEIQMLEWRFA